MTGHVIGRLLARKGALLGIMFLAVITFAAVFARWIIPADPLAQDLVHTLEAPSSAHWFGTDELGRDIMARVAYGARTSLFIAFTISLITSVVGVIFGIVTGYLGGRFDRIGGRVIDLGIEEWANPNAQRLSKRLRKYGDELLTFVEFEGVPSSNNHAEREVRPAVLMRKASYGNQSEVGARTRAVLMSVCRTLKNRGLDPLQTLLDALRTYATSGTLPPLPTKACSGG